MTVDEFDIRFDILYNNLASNAAPALNAYEKSVFLSQAQRDIIIELYNGRNVSGISFESTEEARAYLRDLIEEDSTPLFGKGTISSEKYGTFYKYQVNKNVLSEVLFIVREYVTLAPEVTDYPCLKEAIIDVIPVKQDFLNTILKNPFKQPSKNRILKVDNTDGTFLYWNLNTKIHYNKVYLKVPNPIILNGIDNKDLSIDNVECFDNDSEKYISSTGSCPEILHQVILERAVALAKQAYIG